MYKWYEILYENRCRPRQVVKTGIEKRCKHITYILVQSYASKQEEMALARERERETEKLIIE